MCITNAFFPHKRIHQTTWYPPNPRAEPSLKDYALVRCRLRPSVVDTRVHREAGINSDHRLVVLSLRLKLHRKGSKPQKTFDAQLCKEEDLRRDYMEAIRIKYHIFMYRSRLFISHPPIFLFLTGFIFFHILVTVIDSPTRSFFSFSTLPLLSRPRLLSHSACYPRRHVLHISRLAVFCNHSSLMRNPGLGSKRLI